MLSALQKGGCKGHARFILEQDCNLTCSLKNPTRGFVKTTTSIFRLYLQQKVYPHILIIDQLIPSDYPSNEKTICKQSQDSVNSMFQEISVRLTWSNRVRLEGKLGQKRFQIWQCLVLILNIIILRSLDTNINFGRNY